MSNTAKVSISVPDEELLKWAKERSEKTGVSLSALFTEALRFERQMEARRAFLAEMGPAAVPTPEEAAAIRAELGLDTELGLETVAVLTKEGEHEVRKALLRKKMGSAFVELGKGKLVELNKDDAELLEVVLGKKSIGAGTMTKGSYERMTKGTKGSTQIKYEVAKTGKARYEGKATYERKDERLPQAAAHVAAAKRPKAGAGAKR